MDTKDIVAEELEPTFLDGDFPDSQPTIFVTRHTLGDLLDEKSIDVKGKSSSRESKESS